MLEIVFSLNYLKIYIYIYRLIRICELSFHVIEDPADCDSLLCPLLCGHEMAVFPSEAFYFDRPTLPSHRNQLRLFDKKSPETSQEIYKSL